jgi:hypothetical protein
MCQTCRTVSLIKRSIIGICSQCEKTIEMKVKIKKDSKSVHQITNRLVDIKAENARLSRFNNNIRKKARHHPADCR